MNNKFESLNSEEDVILIPSQEQRIVTDAKLCEVSDLIDVLKQILSKYENSRSPVGWNNSKEDWFSKGVECEVIRPNSERQKGKIRINLEFCPSESEEDQKSSTQSSGFQIFPDLGKIISAGLEPLKVFENR